MRAPQHATKRPPRDGAHGRRPADDHRSRPRIARSCSNPGANPCPIGRAATTNSVASRPAGRPKLLRLFTRTNLQTENDNVAQGQCVGAIRGIIHGYQYGVLFLGQRASLPPNETQRVSLCLNNTPVSSIVDEFIADAAQVNEDSLRHTPAEVAVLGSVHLHHSCN